MESRACSRGHPARRTGEDFSIHRNAPRATEGNFPCFPASFRSTIQPVARAWGTGGSFFAPKLDRMFRSALHGYISYWDQIWDFTSC